MNAIAQGAAQGAKEALSEFAYPTVALYRRVRAILAAALAAISAAS